jgi:hypothetical protein
MHALVTFRGEDLSAGGSPRRGGVPDASGERSRWKRYVSTTIREGLAAYDLFEDSIREAIAAQAFGAAADCHLIIRPLPFEEWARGAAAVAIQSLVV